MGEQLRQEACACSGGRQSSEPTLASGEPVTPVLKGTEIGTSGLFTTGYMIRLTHGGKVASQDKGVLIRDRGSLPTCRVKPNLQSPSIVKQKAAPCRSAGHV